MNANREQSQGTKNADVIARDLNAKRRELIKRIFCDVLAVFLPVLRVLSRPVQGSLEELPRFPEIEDHKHDDAAGPEPELFTILLAKKEKVL